MMAAAPELATDRLLLRQWHESDHAPLAAMMADVSSRFVGGPMESDTAWRLLAQRIGHWHLRGYGFYALEEKASGLFAGWAGVINTPVKGEPELGWALAPAMRGKGYAVEAAARVRRHHYVDLGWTTLMSLIAPENSPSLAVAHRLGAVPEGEQMHGSTMIIRWRHPAPAEVSA